MLQINTSNNIFLILFLELLEKVISRAIINNSIEPTKIFSLNFWSFRNVIGDPKRWCKHFRKMSGNIHHEAQFLLICYLSTYNFMKLHSIANKPLGIFWTFSEKFFSEKSWTIFVCAICGHIFWNFFPKNTSARLLLRLAKYLFSLGYRVSRNGSINLTSITGWNL